MGELVRKYGADAGIALDGDADRVIFCDANGNEVNGDRIIGMLALSCQREKKLASDTVVVTSMSNLCLSRAMKQMGIRVEVTDVGDRYVIERMRAGGLRLAVVSNKAEFAVRTLCDGFFPSLFGAVVGAREGVPKKPDPAGVLSALTALSVAPSEALYVGDSDVDAETARNAGMDCVLVAWGFRDRPLLEQMRPRLLAETAAAVADFALGGLEEK